MCSKTATIKSISGYWDNAQVRRSIEKVKKEMENADAVVIGAGAGLSASAGFTYSGKRFEDNFADYGLIRTRRLPMSFTSTGGMWRMPMC